MISRGIPSSTSTRTSKDPAHPASFKPCGRDIFAETQSLSEYVNLLSERVCKEYGIQFTPEGGTDEQRALSLLQFMSREGIADLVDGMDETA